MASIERSWSSAVHHPPFAFLTLTLSFLLVLAGCSPSGSDRLTIATNWPASQCEAWDGLLAALPAPIRVRWIRVGKAEDPSAILARRNAVDLVLGGPTASYERLAAQKKLQPIDAKSDRNWLAIVRRATDSGFHASARKLAEPEGSLSSDDPRFADRFVMVDPRRDIDSVLGSRLAASADDPAKWRSEYAHLVRAASNISSISLDAEPDSPGPWPALQGLGIAVSAPHPEQARSAIKVLIERRLVESSPAPRAGQSLVPDLLGATLVDAHSQLRSARIALTGKANVERSRSWMTEAPPWPPASITLMRLKPDGEALIVTLAGQVAPDFAARDWLLRSWNRSPKPIDGGTLDEIARAADGQLIAEPRFRAWLRSEWTAWARQRYRRVVRQLFDPRFSTS